MQNAANPGEEKTFYLKMMGDYYRYMAEFSDGQSKVDAANNASSAYEAGLAEASAMGACNPVRLGLALNYSVFLHEVQKDTEKAKVTATTALEFAKQEINS